jgi:FKBP-type peptidyl-prolyl cis-trans isomerase
MKKIWFGVMLMPALTAFAQVNTPEGFKSTPKGLLYKIVIDAGKPKGKLGDIIKLNTVYSTWNDSILFSTYESGMGPVQFTISPPGYSGDPMEGFVMLGEGDSAMFLMPVDSAFKGQPLPAFAKTGEYIRIGVSAISVMSKEEYERKRAEDAKMQTEQEAKTIEAYLAKNNLKAQKTASGIYYIIEQQGTGAKAESGKNVTVNYTGRLLDGKVFDSNVDPKFKHVEPFTFQLGAGRVIKGWDEGIALFNAGGKGTLFIPSPLGYGARASGQIPPNSITIFDVEVLEVK